MKRPEKCPPELWQRLCDAMWELESINHELAARAHDDESPWFSQEIEDVLLHASFALKDLEGWTSTCGSE